MTALGLPSLSLTAELESLIQQRTAAVGIIGLGYVGLPLVLMYCEAGFSVTGFDIDSSKVDSLTRGQSYIHRIPSSEIQLARSHGFCPTSHFNRLNEMDAIVVCVPTPLNEHKEPDLSYITSTMHSIAPHLREGQLIVLESTTYPGTTEEIVLPILGNHNSWHLHPHYDDHDTAGCFFVAFSPEREDPGNTTVPRQCIPKVVGGVSRLATSLACALYGSIFDRTVPVSSPAVAEMTKLLENIYRCVNIAMVNELKLLCLRLGIDIWEVIDAASTKPFGFQPFLPGPGLGGHCIPIDPYYLSWKAKEIDFSTRFIELAGELNSSMPYHVVESITSALNHRDQPLPGRHVLILGVAYKKDVDDLRESPALTIIELLKREGVRVSYNDPYVPRIGRGRHYDLNMSSVSLENLWEYDCVVIITDHSDYNYASVVENAKLVVDTRNATRGISSPKIVRC